MPTMDHTSHEHTNFMTRVFTKGAFAEGKCT
ncbi:Uncharacterised protein [Jonesia denitrificans]|nr:Uncharacterised protein [Jonesia denitrificans]